MELKDYQNAVLQDLQSYLGYLAKERNAGVAFNKYWEDRVGPYNALAQKGMPSYKDHLPSAVHLTIKVPTAGGKTFIAINALHTIFEAQDIRKPKLVIWLVPWSNLLEQTMSALSNVKHPYRQRLNALFQGRVGIYDKEMALQGANFSSSVVQEQLSIIVMSFASLRSKRKADRKVYQENGHLTSFVGSYTPQTPLLPKIDETALINVIRHLNPVVIVDESHNAESKLSVEMLQNLNPSFVLDLTATPKENSNLVSIVSAIRLKENNMVKLPVLVYNHHDKAAVINSALHLQKKLEQDAKAAAKKGNPYVRPIVLFQAQPKGNDDNITFDKIKHILLKNGIPENQIKIKTATKNELQGINLMSKRCPVRYIITINALKEGWDCPFAYILASLANKSSAVDVEQILGRVLRQPHLRRFDSEMLNVSYVLTASNKFQATLSEIVKALNVAGFSEADYRKAEMPYKEEEEEIATTGDVFADLEKAREKAIAAQAQADNDDKELDDITLLPSDKDSKTKTIAILNNLESMAKEEQAKMEAAIAQRKDNVNASDNNLFETMGKRINSYQMKSKFSDIANQIVFPQFFLQVRQNIFFDTTEKLLLNKVALLKGFRLSQEDIKINFEEVQSDIYKIDLDTDNDNRATVSQIEEHYVKDPLMAYIVGRPKTSQVKMITKRLVQIIGNMYPISDIEVQRYVGRVLESLDATQLQDAVLRQYTYRDKIKEKIKQLSETYAAVAFQQQININEIQLQENWRMTDRIVAGQTHHTAIQKSLYKKEGKMNDTEAEMIMSVASLPNVLFWHRNLERGKGFYINGFLNHYPDFIIVTKYGNVILLEVKGGHLTNEDSKAKIRLGKQWVSLAGQRFKYFMVFRNNAIEGAYTFDEAKNLIRQL